jgi:hypothetical protein
MGSVSQGYPAAYDLAGALHGIAILYLLLI